MSSSPQISRQDSISNSLPSFSKINTSSASASVGVSASANSAYKVPAQEETVCQKETVRISPPLHQKEIPVSTYYTNGHLKNSRNIESHAYNLKIKNLTSFDESKVINKSDWTYRRFDRVDRECQTDNYRYCEIHSRNMANDDYEMDTIGNNLYPEIHNHNNETMNDHLPSNSENFPSPPDTESKDRDLEDIDVIAPLNTELSESDNTDFISEQPRLNGSAVSNDNKIYEKSDNSKKRDDWSNKNEEEEEKDTCCTSCLLLTLNICDCVIL
ncbi:hypothetical protein V9T40_004696 [Parthenolecanium corni]|uniref:Uncharacterized protein n=1 Tax=Parthenolecanium corni TaxID=536013 RepID=A0AAN9TGP6_9HEMI